MLLINKITYIVCPHIVKHRINTNGNNYNLSLNYMASMLIYFASNPFINPTKWNYLYCTGMKTSIQREIYRKDYLPCLHLVKNLHL